MLLILYESVPNKKYREIQIRENFFPRKFLTTRCFVILVDPQEQCSVHTDEEMCFSNDSEYLLYSAIRIRKQSTQSFALSGTQRNTLSKKFVIYRALSDCEKAGTPLYSPYRLALYWNSRLSNLRIWTWRHGLYAMITLLICHLLKKFS